MISIATENLGRRFGEKIVFQDIHFEIKAGERVGLIGKNGSGKTTLLRILAGLTAPTWGKAWVAGHSVLDSPARVRASIGWVPSSEKGLISHLTGDENLALFGALYSLSRRKIQYQIERLKGFESLRVARVTPFSLCSSGMKQALLIAKALLSNPSVLLLDEPTRSLDQESVTVLRAFLTQACADRTILFSTHSVEEAAVLAQRNLQLQNGVRVGPP